MDQDPPEWPHGTPMTAHEWTVAFGLLLALIAVAIIAIRVIAA